jgi:phosphoribosylanthranilate isomerase
MFTKPMLVTLGAPVDAAVDILLRTGIRAMQLHGFELPGSIKRLKAAIPNLQIFKTLHVKGGMCLELGMIKAYREVGVDVFIADTFLSHESIGSTGVAIPYAALMPLVDVMHGTPLMLAGGINADRIAALRETQKFWGVDIDSAARVSGQIDVRSVAALASAARPFYVTAPARQDVRVLEPA